MKRNVKLLLKTAARIEAIPESYDQETFCRDELSAPCSTAGCIGGEIIICSERSVKAGVHKLKLVMQKSKVAFAGNYNGPLPNEWVGYVAGHIAGLTKDEAERLFYTGTAGSWPPTYADQFARVKTNRGRARVAVRLLRYLAKGGEV